MRVPEFQCRVKWKVDSVLLIDNHAGCHYGCADFEPSERSLERSYIMEDPSRWSMEYEYGTRDTMGRPVPEGAEDEFRIIRPALQLA
jgi:hypothetical protein